MALSIGQARPLLEALSLAWQQSQTAAEHSFLPLQQLKWATALSFVLHAPLERVTPAELLVEDHSGVSDLAPIESQVVMELRQPSLA